jgi:hypothetical protein
LRSIPFGTPIDVYSIATTACAVVTGVVPFVCENENVLAMACRAGQMLDRGERPGVAPHMVRIITECWADSRASARRWGRSHRLASDEFMSGVVKEEFQAYKNTIQPPD